MGVPVVTLTGQGFCGRHSTAHLANLGLPECVTTTPEDYVGAALALARDPERLAGLRAGLRERMAASPLCDAAGYTRALEAAYRGMWERYCSANKR
jgi:protein O-GlcNAc transferase